MKKFLTSISAILLVLSCTEAIQEESNHENEAITANITPQTRTSMGPGEKGIYKVLWSDGDGIIVSDGMMEGVYTTLEGGSSSAVFIPKSRIPMDFSKGVIAGYPVENMFLGGPDLEEDVYFTIPSVQKYAEGSFDDVTMPMISDIAYEPVLNFRNAAGVLKLVVSGSENVTITSIDVSSPEILSGDLCYNPADQSYIPEEAMTPIHSVSIDCGEGIAVGSEEKAFHIVVPHQTYTGLKVTLNAKDGRKHVFNMKEGKEISVARSSVASIPLKYNRFGTSTAPEISISATSVTFSGFSVNVSMKNVSSYYCGLQSKSSFDSEMSSGSLLEDMSWRTLYTAPMTYSGSISRFQEEFADIFIEPAHDYVFWIVPYSEDGTYTENDIVYIEVATKAYTSGGSTSLTASGFEADMTSISVTLRASGSVEMVYNMLLSEAEVAKYPTVQDKIDLLLYGNAYFFESSSDIVLRKFLDPGSKYTLIAIAVDRSGRYGPLFMQEYSTVPIPYNDIKVSIDESLSALKEDQTIRWTASADDVTEYRYIFTSTDRHLWTGTLGESVKKAGETMVLNPGLYYISKTGSTEARLEMENGKEYIFVILAVDSAGGCSTASHWRFTY